MIVNGHAYVAEYFGARRGHAGTEAGRRQYDAWLKEALAAQWSNPAEIKARYATASILRSGRVVFNIAGNRYRLVVKINYRFKVVDIRFFGTHAEYDRIDAETV